MEITPSEYLKLLVTILVIIFMWSLGTMGYRVNQLNNFEDNVIGLVQAQGGVTDKVIKSANGMSEAAYNGYFSVSPVKNDKSVHSYGKPVQYKIDTNIPWLAFGPKKGSAEAKKRPLAIQRTITGSTTSQVAKEGLHPYE